MSAPPPLPSDSDLRRKIQFSSVDGRIWLAGQRMLLMHTASLATLRRELVQSIGPVATRRLMLRAGFAAGEHDAALAHALRPEASAADRFSVGPQLHMLEGAVQVTPEALDIDLATGRFHGVFRWDHSWEVEAHLRDFGPQTEPVCWTLLGYASGYTSAFMGRMILYKEMACVACGTEHCRIEGKPQVDWPDGDKLARDYTRENLAASEHPAQERRSWPEPVAAEDTPEALVDALGLLIGQSAGFKAAAALLRKAAPTRVSVLLTGETGVGKERFARALHALSPRAAKPFVAVNCGALPGDLIESELFGTEKGAYTGASAARAGRFERADGGTLFLDEIGDLPLPAQAKLLRVLQDGQVERLGAEQTRQVDVRLVAATNVDLRDAVERGQFRKDLYYRINVYPIHIPPLRERKDDIERFARHMLQRFAARHERRVDGLTDRAMHALREHAWPGNVRELENVIERGVILTTAGHAVCVEQLFPGAQMPPGAGPTHTLGPGGRLRAVIRPQAADSLIDQLLASRPDLPSLEADLIEQAVQRNQGNLAAAARMLGLTRPQLSYRLAKIRKQRSRTT
ncbi:MAG: sigma 54-interacting transcriptional regulator [Ottowia sp.]|nr:sigma 54-interacting transcriptional regulator [Ottowia sp.]